MMYKSDEFFFYPFEREEIENCGKFNFIWH